MRSDPLPTAARRELTPLAHGSFETAFPWMERWGALVSRGAAVFLESAGPLEDAGRWCLLAGDPAAELDGRSFPGDADAVLEFLDSVTQGPPGNFPEGLSRAWFGAFAYGFGRTEAKDPAGRPDLYFFKPRRLWVVDRLRKEWTEWGEPGAGLLAPQAPSAEPFHVRGLRAHSTREAYGRLVERVKDYIAAGDLYQANLAQKFSARWEGEPLSLYRILREINPGPFMGLLAAPSFTLVSSSPERLIRGRGGFLETRPIAGTRPRGKDPEEDLRLKQELRSHPKELAEHLMLVDLMRNDLGRVSRYGTVEVSDYARVESYAKVHHLVSTVTARAREDARFSQVFRSVFPGGTITGCPKVRCLQVIDELESEPRHFYTGGLGYLAPGGLFDLNILIRSFTLWPGGEMEFFAGAGIVADSDPDREYAETLHKVEALALALGTRLAPR